MSVQNPVLLDEITRKLWWPEGSSEVYKYVAEVDYTFHTAAVFCTWSCRTFDADLFSRRSRFCEDEPEGYRVIHRLKRSTFSSGSHRRVNIETDPVKEFAPLDFISRATLQVSGESLTSFRV